MKRTNKRREKVREMMRVDRVDSLKVTLLLISLLRCALLLFVDSSSFRSESRCEN